MFADSTMGVNPAHLIQTDGSLTPGALIPLCSYQDDMDILGETRAGLNFTACNKFQPTVLEGQLCYTLDLKSITSIETKAGEDAGIMIILDSGQSDDSKDSKDTQFPRIIINTLSRITNYKNGTYSMSSLKNMKGTSGFMSLPDETKLCQKESYEECWIQRYIKKVQNNCDCIPWTISSAFTDQVIST